MAFTERKGYSRVTALRTLILIYLATVMSLPPLYACKYTVRDIGFVPLRGAEFSLVLRYRPSQRAEDSTGLAPRGSVDVHPELWMGELKKLLTGSNITPIITPIVAELATENLPAFSPENQAIDHQPSVEVRLVDQTGRSVDLTESLARLTSTDQLIEWTNQFLFSPATRLISRQAAETFAHLLIIEGDDQQENARAHQIADQALAALAKIEPLLPRPIAFPSKKLVVPINQARSDSVLLLSLGLSPDYTATSMAVIYGRGKMAGTVMQGQAMNLRETLSQLALVGESCECETDRAWMDEASLPFRWDGDERRRAASLLGFDPESPLVRAEMLRIVSQGSQSRKAQTGSATAGNGSVGSNGSSTGQPDAIERLLRGYSESELASSSSMAPASPDSAEAELIPAGTMSETTVDAPSSLRSQIIAGDGWDFEEPKLSAGQVSSIADKSGPNESSGSIGNSTSDHIAVNPATKDRSAAEGGGFSVESWHGENEEESRPGTSSGDNASTAHSPSSGSSSLSLVVIISLLVVIACSALGALFVLTRG